MVIQGIRKSKAHHRHQKYNEKYEIQSTQKTEQLSKRGRYSCYVGGGRRGRGCACTPALHLATPVCLISYVQRCCGLLHDLLSSVQGTHLLS